MRPDHGLMWCYPEGTLLTAIGQKEVIDVYPTWTCYGLVDW